MKNTQKLFERAKDVDAILVASETNRKYFTGFESTFGLLLLLPGENYFVTDPRYFEMAAYLEKESVKVLSVENGKNGLDVVNDVLRQRNVKNLGFEDTKITVGELKNYESKLNGVKFVPVGEHIDFVRRTKTDEEIKNIFAAQAITDKAFSEILKHIKVNISERDIAIELEYIMRKLGGDGLAFATIVASGVNTSKPHAHPTAKKIEAGDAITMDFGASCNGYCSDMTRTIFVGEPNAEMRKIYNVVLVAQKNALQNVHCGISGKELDALARNVIVAEGYGQYFTHSTGHSLGIDIHEEPRASALSEDLLTQNMFITVQPGIYIPSVGGVRIGDLVLIKETEVINLTTSDKNIIIL